MRKSKFEYDPVKGLLTAEIVEPDNAQLCVRTEYVLDDWGNRQITRVKNCTGAGTAAQFAVRESQASYGGQSVTIRGVTAQIPNGAFATSVVNAKGHGEAREYDPRFGAVISQRGPNQLTTRWEYDDFGRKVLETAPDGNKVVMRYCVLPGQGDSSANSAGCASPAAAPPHAVSYVEAQPQDSTGAASGPYTRKYADALGRVVREETQGFDGAGQPASARTIVKDTEYNAFGAVFKVTQPYFADNGGSSLSQGGVAAGWSATHYDTLGRPETVYVRDDEGNFPHAGETLARTRFGYQGLVSTETRERSAKNAQGQLLSAAELVTTKTSNPLGQLQEVRDGLGGTLRKRYDPFGNVVETQDALNNRIVTVFDGRGRKKQMSDPNAGVWKYDYNALGELTWQQSPKQAVASQATTMQYDELGRMTQRVEPGDYTTSWTWDSCTKGIGKLCQSTTDNGQTKSYTYDSLGRPASVTQAITSGPSFTASTGYDSRGRVASYTYPTGIALAYVYTSLGYLSEIKRGTAAAGTTVWKAGSMNAWGKPESFDLGADGSQNTRQSYDALTGRITGIAAGVGDAILKQTYGWDSVGNLTDRSDRYDASNVVSENFGYDALNRLASYQTSSPGMTPQSKTVTIGYDAIGNILSKSDVGTYTYPASGSGSVRPSAVTSIAGGTVGSRSYSYDEAGNLTASSGSRYTGITYTSFNLPKTLNGSTYTWAYGADHERVREVRSASSTRTTWYFHPDNANGLAFEQEVTGTGTPKNRHYVSAMGRTVLMMESSGEIVAGNPQTPTLLQYWHADHLGSTAAVTDQTGAVRQRYSYDPFGKRRHANGTYDATGDLVIGQSSGGGGGGSSSTDRGFTGHEHLDDVGIVHMNGRTYDPLIARFMQTDPFIQEADSTQNYNRYSYVLNNPLNATDPTGHLKFSKVLRMAAAIALAYWIGPIAFGEMGMAAASAAMTAPGVASCTAAAAGIATNYSVVGAMLGGFVGGTVAGGSLEAGIMGGMTGGAFGMVGANFAPGSFGSYAGHALVGCASAEMQGGSCTGGAISQVLSKGATNATVIANWSEPAQFVSAMAVGGTSSVIGGGKFENGAATAAFGYLFNQGLSALGRVLSGRAAAAAERLVAREGAAAAEVQLLRNSEGMVLGSLEGHLLRNHAGHTVDDLTKRLALDSAKKAVSSFTSTEVAGVALRQALTTNATKVSQWFTQSTSPTLQISVTMSEAVGVVLERTGSAYLGSSATFILARNVNTFPHSVIVITGWVK